MKESSKDTFVLIGILALGGFAITGLCDYFCDLLDDKRRRELARSEKNIGSKSSAGSPLKMNRRTTVISEKIESMCWRI